METSGLLNMVTMSKSSNPYTELGAKDGGSANPSRKAHKQIIAAQTVIFFMSIAIVMLVLSNLYFAVYKQPRDYVLEVDGKNRVTYGGALDAQIVRWEAYMPNEIMHFVDNWRMVTGDNTMQKLAAQRLYCMLIQDTAASTRMDEYYKDPVNDPFEVNKNSTRTVRMRSILQQTESTWQVEFAETSRNHNGEILGDDKMFKAQMIVTRSEPRQSCMESNPLGIYITDINWSSML